jgi:hydrogenase nickel incorporation protein HypA/HybF
VHELSITQELVDTIAGRVGDATVTGVRLEIGALSGVLPDAVRFCFDVVCAGTSLAGARLSIVEPAGRARCRDCADEFDLDDLIPLCPCGGANVEIVSGRQVLIRSVEVA